VKKNRRFIILNKYKMAFVLVPKTGFTSMLKTILNEEYSDAPLDLKDKEIWDYCSSPEVYDKVYNETCPENYRSICFVRNPFSRVYSSFKHFMKYGAKRRKLKGYNEFNSFVKNRLPEITDWHFLPMKYFIDYSPSNTEIYRFEEFEQSMKDVFKEVDSTIKIPHENNSYIPDYHEEYSQGSIEIVKSIYEWDIKKFNYSY